MCVRRPSLLPVENRGFLPAVPGSDVGGASGALGWHPTRARLSTSDFPLGNWNSKHELKKVCGSSSHLPSHLDTWVYIMPLLTSIWPWSYHKYNLAKFQRDNSPQSHCEVTPSLYLDILGGENDTQSNFRRTTSLYLGRFWKINHPLPNPKQPQVSS